MMLISEQLEHTNIRARSSVDDQIVDDLETFDWASGKAHDLFIFAPAKTTACSRPTTFERFPTAFLDSCC